MDNGLGQKSPEMTSEGVVVEGCFTTDVKQCKISTSSSYPRLIAMEGNLGAAKGKIPENGQGQHRQRVLLRNWIGDCSTHPFSMTVLTCYLREMSATARKGCSARPATQAAKLFAK